MIHANYGDTSYTVSVCPSSTSLLSTGTLTAPRLMNLRPRSRLVLHVVGIFADTGDLTCRFYHCGSKPESPHLTISKAPYKSCKKFTNILLLLQVSCKTATYYVAVCREGLMYVNVYIK